MSSPRAFDALRDPVEFFEHLDAHCRMVVDSHVRDSGDGEGRSAHFAAEQRARDLLQSMPYPPREETFLDTLIDDCLDPRGRFVAGGMPHRPHELWILLEDPVFPGHRFQEALRAWYATLPRAPWIEQTEVPLPLFEPESSGALIRSGGLRRPEIRQWPEVTVLSIDRGSDLEDAFRVLADATYSERPWASGGYVDRSEGGLVLPPWRDDGSEPDPDEMALMIRDCGPLEHGVEYVVTDHRPRVVDFHAVSWAIGAPRRERSARPLLLLDIDGVLLPEESGQDDLGSTMLRRLDMLTQRFDLAWATSWESSANSLLRGSEHGSWPVVPVVSSAGNDPDGYDSGRVAPVLEFVGDRSFAWIDDQVGRRDAVVLASERDCLVLRPNPRRGLDDVHVERLLRWA